MAMAMAMATSIRQNTTAAKLSDLSLGTSSVQNLDFLEIIARVTVYLAVALAV